jgi:putative heme iron utilization protein
VSEESHAELARRLVAGTNHGALATVGLDPPGYPFGSVATYALDELGRPVVCMSTLAPHTQNVAADPRASLLVAEPAAPGTDPLDAGRATLVGDLLPVAVAERAAVRDLFLAANPAAAGYVDFGDFGFWRLEVRSVRYVGGYGRMSWVDPADYAAAGSVPDQD